jgi:hypothetical protein
MSFLDDIPIIGSLFGGGSSGGLAGGLLGLTGIPQLIESGVVFLVVVVIIFKLVDKI